FLLVTPFLDCSLWYRNVQRQVRLSVLFSAPQCRISPQGYYISIEIMKSRENRPKEEGLIQWKSVGRRIRELRGFDMNQEQFAQRIGVSQGYVSSMERGEKEVGIEI